MNWTYIECPFAYTCEYFRIISPLLFASNELSFGWLTDAAAAKKKVIETRKVPWRKKNCIREDQVRENFIMLVSHHSKLFKFFIHIIKYNGNRTIHFHITLDSPDVCFFFSPLFFVFSIMTWTYKKNVKVREDVVNCRRMRINEKKICTGSFSMNRKIKSLNMKKKNRRGNKGCFCTGWFRINVH